MLPEKVLQDGDNLSAGDKYPGPAYNQIWCTYQIVIYSMTRARLMHTVDDPDAPSAH